MVYNLNGTTLSTGGSGMLNVLDYGFKGDGTTDNLAAFNDLVAARPGETLYFPKGRVCVFRQAGDRLLLYGARQR